MQELGYLVILFPIPNDYMKLRIAGYCSSSTIEHFWVDEDFNPLILDYKQYYIS